MSSLAFQQHPPFQSHNQQLLRQPVKPTLSIPVSCALVLCIIQKNLGLPITLICKVITPTRTRSLRALIDPGSQITAMKKNIAEVFI